MSGSISRTELKILTALRAIPSLHGLETHHLRLLVSIATEVEFPAGDIIHSEGDLGQAIYFVQEGEIAFDMPVTNHRRVTVLKIGPGQVFGLSSLFPPQRKKARATAVSPVRAIALNAARLRDLFRADHDLERVFMGRMVQIINERVKAMWLELAKTLAAESPQE